MRPAGYRYGGLQGRSTAVRPVASNPTGRMPQPERRKRAVATDRKFLRRTGFDIWFS